MLYILLFIVLVIFFVHQSIHGSKNGKLFNNIPGPSVIPIIGNGFHFMKSPKKLFYYGRAIANKYNNISRFWGINLKILNMYDPDDVEIILSSTKHIDKGEVYKFMHPWLKTGLLTSTDDKWQKRRKILTPTFHFNILRQFSAVFVEQSNALVERLMLEIGKPETEILPYITDFTLRAICETAMGTDFKSTDVSVVSNYKKAIYDFGVIVVDRFTKVWLNPPLFYNLTPMKKRQDQIIKILHRFTSDVIDIRRKTRKAEKNISFINEENGLNKKKRLAMLDLLLDAEENGEINDDGIQEEVDTFMFEGHDTTTMAIMFTLMLLANNPDIQDRIVEEQNEILGESDDVITIEDLNQMKYLERCIKEALRLYPSVPFINRQITEDLQLKNYFIPAGTLINIHSFDMHRKANLFPNPDKYDPDRFLPENCVNRHPFSYIPFSAGPRNCIGQKFAILEEKAVIAAIVRNFKMEAITTPNDIIFVSDIVLRCVNPIKIRFLKRKSE